MLKRIVILTIHVFLLLLIPVSGKVSGLNDQATPFNYKLFKMCEAMPGNEVAALSPFGKPLKEATPLDEHENYAGCHYDLEFTDEYPQVQIEVNEYSTATESQAGFKSAVQSFKDGYGRDPDYISGLADSAAFLGQADPNLCDECELIVVSGRYDITIAFKGYYEKIPQKVKQASAVKILNALFEKKPFLKNKK